MTRIFAVFSLILLSYTVHGQDFRGMWSGAGEYLPGLSIYEMMKQMAAEKKLLFNIGATGVVSGRLTTSYKSKASVPHEGGDQNFILTGKFDELRNKLLLVVTHFRSKPDSSESYLTFMKPDSVCYDVTVQRQNNNSVVTGIATSASNANASSEWVGAFRGGGLSMDASGNNTMHILPLRIRFDIAGREPSTLLPVNSVADAVYHDTIAAAPIHKYEPARSRKIQRTILLDTSHIKLELYDNGEIDGDIATLIFDGKTVLNKQLLSSKAAVLYLDVPNPGAEHVLELYADNLGSIPPNTALVVITCKGKRYEISLSSNETTNGAVKLLFSR